ncbi:MAG: glycosyltransferase family 4 protein [Oleiphilus sp.]
MAVTSSGAKVMHVLSSLRVGGAERFVLDLSNIQKDSGDQVMIFACSSEETPLKEEAEKTGLQCLLTSGSRWADYKTVWGFFREGRGNKVIHIHSPFGIRFFLPLLPVFRLLGISLIYTRHGIAPLASHKWRLIHRWARPFVSYVSFVSDAGKNVFAKTHGWSDSVLSTISNGVYVPKHVEKIASDKIRLGSVGRMVKLKAQKDLIQTVACLDDVLKEKVEIHFFGDGPESPALQEQAKQLSEGQAIFHGMELDRDKVFGQIDILVVCSEQEGLSLAIMEAMARNIPVIATRVGDSPKLVIDDQTGFLYDYADISQLNNHVVSLIKQPELRTRLGQQARQHMVEHFSLEHANAQYQACYH